MEASLDGGGANKTQVPRFAALARNDCIYGSDEACEALEPMK